MKLLKYILFFVICTNAQGMLRPVGGSVNHLPSFSRCFSVAPTKTENTQDAIQIMLDTQQKFDKLQKQQEDVLAQLKSVERQSDKILLQQKDVLDMMKKEGGFATLMMGVTAGTLLSTVVWSIVTSH